MSGSLSSLSRGLQAAFSSGKTELGAEALDLVQTYIDRHSPPSESDRAKLQEELLHIHRQYISSVNSAAFLHVLALLKHDHIIEPDACACWWSLLLSPILNKTDLLKATLKDSLSICLDTLVFKDDDDDFKTRYAAAERLKSCIFESYFEAVVGERRRVTENLQGLIIAFARQRTQEFFEFIDSFLQDPRYRLQSLTLLSAFVRLQTQYIYKITETRLLNSILSCLEQDASTTVVSLALTILIMILPHIPDKLGSLLHRLFRILGRVLCWDRLEAVQRRTAALVDVEKPAEERIYGNLDRHTDAQYEEGRWLRLDASFDIAHSTPPQCSQYFTFLYGMYPVNLLDYIRAASKYSTAATHEPDTELFDDDAIRTRAEIFVKRHLIHPNFTKLTSGDERSDTSRWMKLEPSDVVNLCISLDTVNVEPARYAAGDTDLDRDIEVLNLDKATGHDEDWTKDMVTETEIPRLLSLGDGAIQIDHAKSTMDSTLAIPNEFDTSSRLASPAFQPRLIIGGSVKHTLPSRTSSTSRSSLVSPTEILRIHEGLVEGNLMTMQNGRMTADTQKLNETESHLSTSFYQRELLLLRNELNFERHLKQQHLQHIGRLQRDVMSDAALEAERQSLYSTTRALKAQVRNLQSILQRLRSETATAKANRAAYEAGLNERIKKLREEKLSLQQNEKALHDALELAKNDVKNMQVSLGIAEGTAFNLQQQLQILEPEIKEAKDLQKNFELLRKRIKEAEIQDIQLKMERERVMEAQSRTQAAVLQADALRGRLQELSKSVEDSRSAQAMELSPALPMPNPNMEPAFRMLTERLNAASGPFDELKKRHKILVEEHMQLTLKAAKLEAELESLRLSSNHASSAQQRPPAVRRSHTSSLSIAAPDRTSIASPVAPSVSTTAAYGNVGYDGVLTHGQRRTSPQPEHWEERKEQGLLSTNTLESFRLMTEAKSTGSSVNSNGTKKENKDKTILGGRFRW